MSLNKVMLIGRLGADPEFRYTQDGRPVAKFRMATNSYWKKDEEKQTRTEWHRVIAFGRTAEICQEYLKKGRQVYVEGPQRTRSWEDQDGNKRWTTEVAAQNILMLGNRPDEVNHPETEENEDPPF